MERLRYDGFEQSPGKRNFWKVTARMGGAHFEMVLMFRVAAPSRSFEGADVLVFSLE